MIDLTTDLAIDLIDIGANLTHASFDADRSEVIRAAAAVGVSRMILTGSSAESSQQAHALAEQWPGQLFATAGVHPHHASDYSDAAHLVLQHLLESDKVVAVGECGLDYFRNFSPENAQRMAFERQLDLAEQSQLPLFLHQRDAHDDFVEILEPRLRKLGRAVAHCFTGNEEELLKYVDMGLYVGITGWICDERRGAHLKEIVRHIPLNRLLLETDAPYLMPRSLAAKPATRRNEPQYLPEVLRVVAESLQQEEAVVARATTENAERFFAIPAK